MPHGAVQPPQVLRAPDGNLCWAQVLGRASDGWVDYSATRVPDASSLRHGRRRVTVAHRSPRRQIAMARVGAVSAVVLLPPVVDVAAGDLGGVEVGGWDELGES